MQAWLHFGVVVLVLLSYLAKSQWLKNSIWNFAIIVLILLFGCRSGTYPYERYDLNIYYNYFNNYISTYTTLDTGRFEIGYKLFNYLLSCIVYNPQMIFFAVGAFCIGLTYWFIRKVSIDVALSLLVFICLTPLGLYMTGFRQGMAMTLCLLGLYYLLNDKKKMFCLFVILAFLFHKTALSFFPVIFLYQLKINLRNTVIVSAGSIIMVMFVGLIMNYANAFFGMDYQTVFTQSKTGGLIDIAIMLACIALTLYIYNKITFDAKHTKIIKLTYPLVFGCALYIMRYQSEIIQRISFYYFPITLLLIPFFIQYAFKCKTKLLTKGIAIAILIFLLFWRQGYIDYIPLWS